MDGSKVSRIAVIGAGTMGHGIAELAALSGFRVALRDVKQDLLDRARDQIAWSLGKLVEKNQVTRAAADAAAVGITYHLGLADAVREAEFVIEAVPEHLELKRKVFQELDAATRPDVVLATNTSGIRVTEIAERCKHPERVTGMHFFAPVLLMDLIEVVKGEASSAEAVLCTEEVSKRLGKQVVTLRADPPGFITTRLVGSMFGVAGWLVAKGKTTPRQVDAAMRFKEGFPMGPFEVADSSGIDVAFDAGKYLSERLGKGASPPPVIEEKVKAGHLGMKTKKGFYDYAQGRPKFDPREGEGFDTGLVMSVVANEAAKLIADGVADAEEVDKAMRLGLAFVRGPCKWADETGIEVVVGKLESLVRDHGLSAAEPAPLLRTMVKDGWLGKRAGRGFFVYDAAGTAGTARAAFETVLVERRGPVGWITLNRPNRLNSLTSELIRDLGLALDQHTADEEVRVIALRGAGEKAFSAGADLTATGGTTPFAAIELARSFSLVLHKIEKLPKPVLAAINGFALGGGFELALACDLRVAAKRAEVGLPELRVGLLPGSGGTQRLTKLVGRGRAKELIWFGKRIGADEAKGLGLVNEVYANDVFETKAQEYAEALAKCAPLAVRLTKYSINMGSETTTDIGHELEALGFGLLVSTEDVIEGISSFMAKKEPEFKGK